MTQLQPAPTHVFSSRKDPDDLRLGDLTLFSNQVLSSKNRLMTFQESFVILGYPDDEGIRINGGRPGAALGPDSIRQLFYKTTPTNARTNQNLICDLGNISNSSELGLRHQFAQSLTTALFKSQKKVITLGGGHDYGFPDTAAFLEAQFASKEKVKPLIINFDAHLDVRPTDRGLSSGTPFFRLLEAYDHRLFDFVEVGIQPQCNSTKHFEYLRKKNIEVLFHDQVSVKNLAKTITLGRNKKNLRPCFISLDIDAFHSSEAPGCSQSWPLGFKLENFLPVFDFLLAKTNVCGLGIYEVSPPLDFNMNTQRLAALIMHRYLFAKSNIKPNINPNIKSNVKSNLTNTRKGVLS